MSGVTSGSGHGLIVVLVAYYVGFAYAFVIGGGPVLDLPFIAVVLVATALVHRDTNMINKLAGFKSINVSLWSWLTLIFGYIVLPVYVFAERRRAVTEARASWAPSQARFCSQCGSPVEASAGFCSTCGARLAAVSDERMRRGSRNYDLLVLAVIGALGLTGGIKELVAPVQIPTQNLPQNESLPFTPPELLFYTTLGLTVVCAIFLILAVAIYKRRAKRSSRA